MRWRPWLAFSIGLVMGASIALMVIRRSPHAGPPIDEASRDHRELSRTERRLGSSAKRDDQDSLLQRAKALGESDPERGWTQGMAIANLSEREAFMEALMESWARHHPEAALAKAGELGAGRLRTECFAAACRGWARNDPAGAAKWAVENLAGPILTQSSAAIATSWSESDPSAAAEWSASLSTDPAVQAAMAQAFKTWLDKDPQAAAAWAAARPEGDARNSALLLLALEWSDQNPAAAAQWIGKQVAVGGESELVDVLLNRWSADDPVAAAEWVGTLPADHQADAYRMMLSVWGTADPVGAADWLAKFPEGQTRERAIPALAETWAGIDPQAAVIWTLSLPPTPEATKALDQSVRVWALNQRGSIKEWIDSQPTGAGSDRLRSLASTVISEHHPAEAAAMAIRITDPAMRENAVVDVVSDWRETDPKSAAAWLKQQKLDAAILDRLAP